MSSATAPAAGTGLPKFDAAEVASLIFHADKLARLSMKELHELSRTFDAACELIALSHVSHPERLTLACSMLEGLNGILVCALHDIREAAQVRQPEGHHETIWRALLSLRHAALVSDDLADIAALSAQASAAEREFLTTRR